MYFKLSSIAVLVTLAAANAEENNNPKLPSGWHVHDMARPMPEVVTPGATSEAAPSDAIVLFDGTNLDAWSGSVRDTKEVKNPDGKPRWKLENGYMEVTPTGGINTKQSFGDIQLHLEWAAPTPPVESAQKRGNSGVFLMGRYEIQIMDAYENNAYPDGMAAAIYGQTPALVNAARKPGEWQTYDIIFKAPKFEGEKMISPPIVTILHNGVLVQNHTEILGGTQHNKLPVIKSHGEKAPIALQNHGQPVRFRNIWVREL